MSGPAPVLAADQSASAHLLVRRHMVESLWRYEDRGRGGSTVVDRGPRV